MGMDEDIKISYISRVGDTNLYCNFVNNRNAWCKHYFSDNFNNFICRTY